MVDARRPGLLHEAADLRRRYAVKDSAGQRVQAKISLEDLCIHPQNRGGTFPSAARVVDLLRGIMEDRFLAKEAQHEAVVVQELLANKMHDYEVLRGKPYKTHCLHNKKHTESAQALRDAFADLSTFSYGSSSRCTLSLGLMSIKHGAAWELPEEHKMCGLEEFQTGPDGAWDVPKMRRDERFSEFVDVFDNGLLCEVLSWEINFDKVVAEGPGLIAAALNDPQGKGVTTHEMEIFKTVADYADAAAAESQR